MDKTTTTIADLPIEMIYKITHNLNYYDMLSFCNTNKVAKSMCNDDLWKYKTNYDFDGSFRYLLLDNENYRQGYLRIASYNQKYYRGSENYVSLHTIASNLWLVLPRDYDYFISRISYDDMEEVIDNSLKHNKISIFWKIRRRYNNYTNNEFILTTAAKYNRVDVIRTILREVDITDSITALDVLLDVMFGLTINCHFGEFFNEIFTLANSYRINDPIEYYSDILINASKCGNFSFINTILSGYDDDGENIDIFNNMLVTAADMGHVDIVQLLLNKGADNYDDAMIDAAINGNIEIVELILEQDNDDYDMESTSFEGRNMAMKESARYGHIDIVRLMLLQGANNYNSSAKSASTRGYINIVKLMIEKGANNYNNIAKNAAQYGRTNIVRFMLLQGANNYTEIAKIAARYSHLKIFELMLDQGIDNYDEIVSFAYPDVNTITYPNIDIAKLILENDVNKYCQLFIGLIPLDFGENFESIEDEYRRIEMLNRIISYDPNKCVYKLNEALNKASTSKRHIKIVELLLEQGADNYNEAMEIAVQNGSVDIVQLLIRHGADKFGLIIDASREGYVDIVNLLIYNIEKLYYESSEPFYSYDDLKYLYNNALLEATEHNQIGIVQILLNAGADAI